MALFLDTEFSEFGGQLISIAIVSDDGDEFYAVRHLPAEMHPWVRENVLPILVQEPEDDHIIKKKLVAFLNRQRGQPVYGDWPEDFTHLLFLLCEPNGIRYDVGDLEMHLVSGIAAEPEVPHNALSDARALMKGFYAN